MAYTTRKSMLLAMQRNENAAWEEFLEFYGPLITLRANDYRLTPQETEELRQDICVSIFTKNSLASYDPARGRVRDYLRGIITHRAVDIIRRRPQQGAPAPEPSSAEEDRERFEREWREFVFEKALAEVKSRCDDLTFMAFQLHAWQGRPAKEVAQELGMTEQNVFLASSRITQRLRAEVKRLEKELEE